MKDNSKAITIVRQFCSFIETVNNKTGYAYLMLLRQHLLRLYECGLQLPEVELKDTIPDEPEPDAKHLQHVAQSLSNCLSHNCFYCHVFDPSVETDKEVVTGDLPDDIYDIYKDLKCVLLLWNIGTETAQAGAGFNLRFLFIHHWGDHCMNALYAIHYFLQKSRQACPHLLT